MDYGSFGPVIKRKKWSLVMYYLRGKMQVIEVFLANHDVKNVRLIWECVAKPT